MIPILYESTETAFASNGLGRLRDCISCVVTEERNGIYECDFEYPVNGSNYSKIQLGRIIAVEHDDSTDVQPFDIVSCSRPINGVVSFHAVHISYRQRFMTVSGTNINSLSDAFTALGNATPSNPFSYETDKTSTGYVASFNGVPRSVRSILGGVEGSILDAYGGEYEWDKWNVILHSARGSMRNFTIRYGVNMLDYSEEMDYSETYTAVIPYWTDSSTGAVVQGSKVSSGASAYNGVESVVPLDLTEKFETQPTTAQLESMASSYMASNQTYLPAQSITVDFVRLQDSAEYQYLAPLLNCSLCDTIKVEMPMYGMSGQFKIVKTVYDVLLERFSEMELGTLSTSLAEALGIGEGTSSTNNASDYIEETGTGNGWTYRKWHSGISECWGGFSVASKTYAAGGGAVMNPPNIPTGVFNAVNSMVINATARISGVGNSTTGFTAANNTTNIQIWILNVGASAVTNTAYVQVHIKGTWK